MDHLGPQEPRQRVLSPIKFGLKKSLLKLTYLGNIMHQNLWKILKLPTEITTKRKLSLSNAIYWVKCYQKFTVITI